MRGKILLKALDFLYDGAMNQIDFFQAVLVAGYGASAGRIDYEYQKLNRNYENKKFQAKNIKIQERRLMVFISKMKHDGLIKTSGNKLIISDKGKNKYAKLKNDLPSRYYQKEKGKHNLTIISFDIPEKLRRKRNWLREVIRNLGFQMVHQSVWMGKVKIPKDFVLDLENLKILEFVEIFEISKTGSLNKLTQKE